MKFFKQSISLFLFCVIILPTSSRASAKAEWRRTQTKNFELAGNAADAEIQRAGQKMEQFRALFLNLFNQTNFNAPAPTRIVVFKDRQTLEKFKPVALKRSQFAGGFFQPGEEIDYIAVSLENETPETFRAIFHDYAQNLLENSIGRAAVPAWLSEGLAEYYAQASLGREARLGVVNERHLAVLQQQKLIPFEIFFTQDYYSLQSQTEETSALFEAQAWALSHYLLSDPEKTQKMRRFVELLAEGQFQIKAFTKAFQTDYAALEAELKQAVSKGKFTETSFELPALNLPAQLTPLTESAAKAIEGDLLFRVNRTSEAEKVLAESIRLNPNQSPANLTLGLLRARERKFEEAAKHLERALKSDPDNFLTHYGAAYITSRQEMTGYGFVSGYTAAEAEKMREQLRRAISLNPNFGESYQLLAFVDFVRNEQIEEGLAMIEKALELAPGNAWYQLRKAQLLTRREKFTEARKIMFGIIPHAPDDRLKVSAENALTVMNSLEAQLLNAKNPRFQNPDDGVVTDEPVSEEELRRRREKAMIESLNVALRVPAAGEKRVLGTVTKIDCQNGGIYVSVKTEGELLRLKTESFNNLILTAFDNEQVAAQIGCGVLKKEGFSVVTFRPPASAGETGEIVAIEFVPKYFKFAGQNK